MKMEIRCVEEKLKTLQEFAEEHGLILVVEDCGEDVNPLLRFSAYFKDSARYDYGCAMYVKCFGKTPDDAIDNFRHHLSGGSLRVDLGNGAAKYINVPKLKKYSSSDVTGSPCEILPPTEGYWYARRAFLNGNHRKFKVLHADQKQDLVVAMMVTGEEGGAEELELPPECYTFAAWSEAMTRTPNEGPDPKEDPNVKILDMGKDGTALVFRDYAAANSTRYFALRHRANLIIAGNRVIKNRWFSI